jgi:multidrug transporter EmrE-like cation transporter
MNPIAFILLFVGGIILTVGDIFMKKWVGTNNYYFYFAGLVIYIVSLNLLAFSFKYKNIAVASIIYIIFNIVTLSIVSWFYFKETLNTMQMVGITLGLISVIVLELA